MRVREIGIVGATNARGGGVLNASSAKKRGAAEERGGRREVECGLRGRGRRWERMGGLVCVCACVCALVVEL